MKVFETNYGMIEASNVMAEDSIGCGLTECLELIDESGDSILVEGYHDLDELTAFDIQKMIDNA